MPSNPILFILAGPINKIEAILNQISSSIADMNFFYRMLTILCLIDKHLIAIYSPFMIPLYTSPNEPEQQLLTRWAELYPITFNIFTFVV
jgi:hypothetical protein